MQYKGGGLLLEREKHRDGWCVSASFLPSLSFTLCQLLWVSITPQSKWMVWEGLLQRVKPPLLMSPVFNHHTVEWFYAYFICISLNRVSKGHSEPGEVQSWGEREEKKVPMMLIFKRGLFHDLSSTFAKIIMTWKPLKLDTTLDSSNSCRAVYFLKQQKCFLQVKLFRLN